MHKTLRLPQNPFASGKWNAMVRNVEKAGRCACFPDLVSYFLSFGL
jgi:hypothetical protein